MSDLSKFRVGAEPTSKKPRKVWQPPTIGDLAQGLVLAVDQSLGALGWVWLLNDDGGLSVLAKGTVRIKPDDFPVGHEGTLLRGLEVYRQFGEQMSDARTPVLPWQQTVFVHETPPVGGRMARPESSLVSAMAVRIYVANEIGRPMTMVANQHSKSVLVGNANATKKVWHTGLGYFTIGGTMPTNEGERDALCLAVTYFYDQYRSTCRRWT